MPRPNFLLFSPAIFLTSRKNISPLGSPNLFARRQAFAAIRRRTQWINRKINGKKIKTALMRRQSRNLYSQCTLLFNEKAEGAMKI